MIQFKSIYISNFSSFEEVEFKYANKGLHLIQGENVDSSAADSNMAGKTNLFEALIWCLFGEATKEKNTDGAKLPSYTADSVIRRGQKECVVKVDFTCGGELYMVLRKRARGGAGGVRVIKGGTLLKGKSKAATQDLIEQILGLDYNTFTQVVLFGQGIRRFSQARDSERKRVLEQLLQLDVFSNGLVGIRASKSNLVQSEDEIEKSMVRVEAKLEELDLQLDSAEAMYLASELNSKEWKAELKKRKDGIREQIKGKQKKITNLKASLKTALAKVSSLLDKIKAGQKYRTRYNDVGHGLNNLNSLASIERTRRDDLEETESECPTCEQPISEKHLAKVREKCASSLKKINLQRSVLDKKYDDLRLEIVNLNATEALLNTEKGMVTHCEEWIEEHTNRLANQKESLKDIEKLRPDLIKPDRTALGAIEGRMAMARVEHAELIGQRVTIQKELEDVEFWENAFGNQGIKSLMMDDILPILNSRASKYVALLSGGEIDIEFDTESYTGTGKARDKFDVRITTSAGEGYHYASGGGRRRVDFAIALALQSLQAGTGNRCNLFILDEPFESVDETGQEELVNLLRQYSEEYGVAVYCITHLSTLKPLFDETITVRKRNGVSTLVDI